MLSEYSIELRITKSEYSARVYESVDELGGPRFVVAFDGFNTLGALMHAVVRSIYAEESSRGQQDVDR